MYGVLRLVEHYLKQANMCVNDPSGPLVIAIVYLFSMLHFGLPSAPLDPGRENTFRGCQRGPQYAMTTLSPVNELLAQQPHGGEGQADSQEPLRQLEARQEGSQAQEKFYYFQGLYVPAVEPPKNRYALHIDKSRIHFHIQHDTIAPCTCLYCPMDVLSTGFRGGASW